MVTNVEIPASLPELLPVWESCRAEVDSGRWMDVMSEGHFCWNVCSSRSGCVGLIVLLLCWCICMNNVQMPEHSKLVQSCLVSCQALDCDCKKVSEEVMMDLMNSQPPGVNLQSLKSCNSTSLCLNSLNHLPNAVHFQSGGKVLVCSTYKQ